MRDAISSYVLYKKVRTIEIKLKRNWNEKVSKPFCFSFVPVLFQLYFNCADNVQCHSVTCSAFTRPATALSGLLKAPHASSLRLNQWRRLHGARCPPPTFTNGWARGGAPWVEEQQTKNWPNCTNHHKKRSPKRLIVLLEPKSGWARPKKFPARRCSPL